MPISKKLKSSILLISLLVILPLSAGLKEFGSKIKSKVAGPFKSLSNKIHDRPEAMASSEAEKKAAELFYQNIRYGSNERVALRWAVAFPEKTSGIAWMGSTLKKIPYSEVEFNALRDKKVREKVEFIKNEHIRRRREAKEREAGLDGQAFDNFLEGIEEEGEKELTEEEKEEFLIDFDETAVTQNVINRLIVDQYRVENIVAIYVQLPNYDLYCIDAATGLTLWVSALNGMMDQPAYETKDRLYAIILGRLIALDKRSGYASLSKTLDHVFHKDIFVRDDDIFMTAFNQRLYRYPVDKRYPRWMIKAEGEPVSGVFSEGESLYVPTQNGEFSSYNLRGDLKWKFINKGLSDEKIYLEKKLTQKYKEIQNEKAQAKREVREEDALKLLRLSGEIDELEKEKRDLAMRSRGRFMARPSFIDDDIFFGSTDFNLYKLNRHSGIPAWSYNSGAELVTQSIIAKDYVFQKDSSNMVHRVNRETGEGEVILDEVEMLYGSRENKLFYRKNGHVNVFSGNGGGVIKGTQGFQHVLDKSSKFMALFNKESNIFQVYDTSFVR